MMTKEIYSSNLAIPPGEYLEENLQALDINQADLARRMGRPAQTINEIISGTKAITPETALQLEQVLGISACVWSNLETEYRLILARQAAAQTLEDERPIAKCFPYNEIAKLELVKSSRAPLSRIKELRRFFGVSSLFNIQSVKEYSPAFRQNTNGKLCQESLAAWLRAGHIMANKTPTATFNKSALESHLLTIKQLTNETSPQILLQKLRQLLANCGVALIVIPHFSKTYTTGATFWASKDKAVVMMSLRGSWSDIFWFSLLHELGHVLLHDKRVTFLENKSTNPEYLKQENEADLFSQSTLIPAQAYKKFKQSADFSPHSIQEFAKTIGVFPGIVTGRLQHDKILPHTLNYHRIRFKWVN